MTEEEFQNILVISYFLTEQGRLDEAMHVLLLASAPFGADPEFNRMLIMIFYLKKDYQKCVVLFKKYPHLVDSEPVFKQVKAVCMKMSEEA